MDSPITQAINLFVHFQTSDITLTIFYVTPLDGSCSLVLCRIQLAHLLQLIDWLGFGQYLIPLVWTEYPSTPELHLCTSRLTSFSDSYTIQYTTEFLPMQSSTHYNHQCPCFHIGMSSSGLCPIQPTNPPLRSLSLQNCLEFLWTTTTSLMSSARVELTRFLHIVNRIWRSIWKKELLLW